LCFESERGWFCVSKRVRWATIWTRSVQYTKTYL